MQPIQIYLAAVYTNGVLPGGNHYDKFNEQEKQIVDRVKYHNILESYHYVNKQKFVDTMRQNEAKIFLDSGAFSAFTTGATIDLPTYCNYILSNEDIIRKEDGILMASVLDSIGGERPEQVTYENLCRMEQLGVRALPCFHAGEDVRYLDYYVSNYEYITLGGMVGTSTKQLEIWLDRMWNNHLLDGAGNPKTRVHGFGITSEPIMERYPWYSCDSSSWVQASSFGSVVTDEYGVICVSSNSPSAKIAGQHITTMSQLERQRLEQFLNERGFDVQRLGDEYISRFACNLMGYMDINVKMNTYKETATLSIPQELF